MEIVQLCVQPVYLSRASLKYTTIYIIDSAVISSPTTLCSILIPAHSPCDCMGFPKVLQLPSVYQRCNKLVGYYFLHCRWVMGELCWKGISMDICEKIDWSKMSAVMGLLRRPAYSSSHRSYAEVKYEYFSVMLLVWSSHFSSHVSPSYISFAKIQQNLCFVCCPGKSYMCKRENKQSAGYNTTAETLQVKNKMQGCTSAIANLFQHLSEKLFFSPREPAQHPQPSPEGISVFTADNLQDRLYYTLQCTE